MWSPWEFEIQILIPTSQFGSYLWCFSLHPCGSRTKRQKNVDLTRLSLVFLYCEGISTYPQVWPWRQVLSSLLKSVISHAACSFVPLLKVNGVVLCGGIIVLFLLEEVVFRDSGGVGMRSSIWLYGFYFLVESVFLTKNNLGLSLNIGSSCWTDIIIKSVQIIYFFLLLPTCRLRP